MHGIATKASIPRGLLRFALLLVAACLVGALIGILTEPFAKKAAADSTGARGVKEPTASPANESAVDPEKAVSKEVPAQEPSLDSNPSAATASEPRGFLARSGQDSNALAKALAPDFSGLAIVGVILGAFALIAFVLTAKTRQRRASNGVVHLVDSLPIAPGRSVHLLRCEGRKFLIGNSERGIHFLASIPQNEIERALDAVVDDNSLGATEGEPTFENLLAGSAPR